MKDAIFPTEPADPNSNPSPFRQLYDIRINHRNAVTQLGFETFALEQYLEEFQAEKPPSITIKDDEVSIDRFALSVKADADPAWAESQAWAAAVAGELRQSVIEAIRERLEALRPRVESELARTRALLEVLPPKAQSGQDRSA
ncbi:MAG: hypothetical protein AAFV53_39345 [Myxococcota bacterium]